MSDRRDCVFLIADGQMSAVFSTFLTLPHYHEKLGVAPFRFQPERDLIEPMGGRNDPNVYEKAHVFLGPYRNTHERAVVVLDEAWGHERSADTIASDIKAKLVRSGWPADRCAVIVIVPELEAWIWQAWIWQDSPHVEAAFYRNLRKEERDRLPSLRTWLRDQGLWPDGLSKPPDPKAAVLRARGAFRAGSQIAIYQSICQRVSVKLCADPAFCLLRETLRRWFPPSGEVP